MSGITLWDCQYITLCEIIFSRIKEIRMKHVESFKAQTMRFVVDKNKLFVSISFLVLSVCLFFVFFFREMTFLNVCPMMISLALIYGQRTVTLDKGSKEVVSEWKAFFTLQRAVYPLEKFNRVEIEILEVSKPPLYSVLLSGPTKQFTIGIKRDRLKAEEIAKSISDFLNLPLEDFTGTLDT